MLFGVCRGLDDYAAMECAKKAGIDYFDILGMAKKGYSKLLAPICEEYGLTRNELDVLLFLHNNPEYDRAVDIVNNRGLSKSHVSLSISGLEEKGLLKKNFVRKFREKEDWKLSTKQFETGVREKEWDFGGNK